jgi:pyruvate formate lyase activating enzyme
MRSQPGSPPTGTIFDIRRFSVHDGPGIRTTVFFKGCPLRCWWCHNPESQSFQPEILLNPGRCIRCGACVAACPEGAIPSGQMAAAPDPALCTRCGACTEACAAEARELAGRVMSVSQVMAEVGRDLAFYDQSGGGVTFSGGEPLAQPGFLAALLRACKSQEIRTALDTSGYAPWKTLAELAPDVDLFLYDLKLVDPAAHRRMTGVSNQRILSNLFKLSELGARLILRVPVIPGVNADPAAIRAVAEIARQAGQVGRGIEEIDLLPYHQAAIGKYERMDLPYALPEVKPPTPEDLDSLAEILEGLGNKVKIGG